eukprot:869349-Pyramimonas_sp.AAC.1
MAAEVFFLGPLGPFIVGTSIKTVKSASKFPGFVIGAMKKKNPLAIAAHLADGPGQFFASLSRGHKVMLIYAIMHQ